VQAAAVAGWLVGHYGATPGCGRRVLIAAARLAAEAFSAAALWALVIAGVIFVLGVRLASLASRKLSPLIHTT